MLFDYGLIKNVLFDYGLIQNVLFDYGLIKIVLFDYGLINPLPVQFKALLHGQKGCVFFSGHLNLRTAPETGLPSREKNHNN